MRPQVQAQGGLRVSGFPEQHVHSSYLGYGLQLASFNGLYTLLPPASVDAFPVWQKQPIVQEEDQEEGAEGESSGGVTEEASNKEGPQQRFLYFYEATWRFNGENTPDKEVCWAFEKTGGRRPLLMDATGPRSMAWSVFTGEEVEDMALTVEPADRSYGSLPCYSRGGGYGKYESFIEIN
eukprot:COSAG05_NODE_1455_length_4831_cov_1.834954_5_plen_180_part_00